MVNGGSRQSSNIIGIYMLTTFIVLTVFGALHVLVENDALLGYLEWAAGGAIAITMLALKVTGNVVIARVCFLFTILAVLVAMLITGGIQGTGIYWFFMFPVAAFFLAGVKEGLAWLALLFGVVLALWAGAGLNDAPFFYHAIEIRQLLISLAVVSLGLYVYQYSREAWERKALKSQRELKAYLRQMTDLHAKVDRTKSEFVTLTSHQLRTPISAIRWFSEMLLNGDAGKLTSTQADAVKGIQDSSARLGLIVNAMLTVSSLELGDVYVRPEPTDLALLSRKVLRETVKRYSNKELTVHQDYDDLPKLKLDDYITRQMLKNLFSNACKYTPPHGIITVTITRTNQRIRAGSAGSVAISVSDTGYGIPASQQQDVFAKLFRAENIKTKDTDGTGLGLYIVKAMADLVGGQVSFVSAEDRGSTFTILLPLEGMKKHDIGIR